MSQQNNNMDPINASIFATYPTRQYNAVIVPAEDNDDGSRVENMVLRCGGFAFDIELRINDAISVMVLAPRRVPGEERGCVVFEFDSTGGQPTVDIANIVHDAMCSRNDVAPLEKKYGTRAMVLGSLNLFMSLARARWPHLSEFHLQDESTYTCLPLEKKERTFATDLFVRDTLYYERHLNVKPTRLAIRRLIDKVLIEIKGPMRVKYGSFKAFWKKVAPACVEGGGHTGHLTREKASWLELHMSAIQTAFDRNHSSGASWRDFFTEMHGRYSCSFFSCLSNALVHEFHMESLLGAGWMVDFRDVPLFEFQIGGAASPSRRKPAPPSARRKLRLEHLFAHAVGRRNR
jgi:hypothetical protein